MGGGVGSALVTCLCHLTVGVRMFVFAFLVSEKRKGRPLRALVVRGEGLSPSARVSSLVFCCWCGWAVNDVVFLGLLP